MSDYPTSGTRGGQRPVKSAFVIDDRIRAALLGGFLAPGTEQAIRNLGPEAVKLLAAQLPKDLASLASGGGGFVPKVIPPSSAVAGFMPYVWPVLRVAALYWAAWELWANWGYYKVAQLGYEFSGFSQSGNQSTNFVTTHGRHDGLVVFEIPPGSTFAHWADVGEGSFGTALGGAAPADAHGILVMRSYYTGDHREEWQMHQTWTRPGVGDVTDPRPDHVYQWPQPGPSPFPLKVQTVWSPFQPPGMVPSMPPTVPYEAIPGRIDDPSLAPSERSERGYRYGASQALTGEGFESVTGVKPGSVPETLPATGPAPVWPWPSEYPPGYPDIDPSLDPVFDPAPGTQTVPGDLPGVPVPHPQVPPAVDPGVVDPTTAGRSLSFAPPVAYEWPQGAFGPSLIIGGGNSIGAHQSAPPDKRTKERKVKLSQGALMMFKYGITRGVNPITEALEVLDCGFKSLDKATRWNALKAHWNEQKAEAKAKGYKFSKRPRQAPGKGLKLEFGSLDERKGASDQSISLPGFSPRRYKFADPGGHYMTGLSPLEKAKEIYRHLDKMSVGGFIQCVALNEVEDRLFGAMGRALGSRNPVVTGQSGEKGSGGKGAKFRLRGLPTGFGTGRPIS